MEIVSSKSTQTNITELEIKVDAKTLDEGMEKVYLKQRETISVSGFRKGKAPRKIIEKMHGQGVFMEDAINDIYPDAYRDALKETEIEPVAPGDIEIIDASPTEGFTFKATITTKPEINIADYKGIKAEKEIVKVLAEEVNKEIETLRERGSRLVEVTDRKAKKDDNAIIDFEGFSDGEAFEGGKGEEFDIVLGSNTFIPGFEEQIIGHSVGDEFDVNVEFPEEYHSDDLAGKPAMFKVKLNGLKEKELPELDDEFAKDVSEFDTLKDLKADLKKNLQEIEDKNAEEALENSLIDKVIEKIEGEIPEVMYDVRVDSMVRDFAQRLTSQGMNMDLYLQYTGMDMESFRKTFREQAERQVKINLALDKIVEIEKIDASEEDVEKEYKKLAELYKIPEDEVGGIIPKDAVEQDVKSGKAIDLIRKNAVITEIAKKDKKEAKTEDKDKKDEEDKTEDNA